MKIVCSSNMPYAAEAFGTLGTTVVLPGRDIAADDVRDADILAIRSTTRVDGELLAGSRVQFVGTATIGTNHMDVGYLEERGIEWCCSPGCNAESVAEYIVASLLHMALAHGLELADRTAGVIGVGNVGTRVAAKAAALGMRVLQNDPPRQRRGDNGPFVSLERVLTGADIVTMHVPLTKDGPDCTETMAGAAFFEKVRPAVIFLNSSRGEVVDTDALIAAVDGGKVGHAVIDTWDGEPAYRDDLLARVDIGTPHIAGHSFEGKVAGTVAVYENACRFLGVEPSWRVDNLLPSPPVPQISADADTGSIEEILHAVVSRVYDVGRDDRDMRQSCSPDVKERSRRFDELRRNYRVRREFRNTRVIVTGKRAGRLRQVLTGLGFRCED